MMHLACFDKRYKDSDVLTQKEWRIILNKTVNCTACGISADGGEGCTSTVSSRTTYEYWIGGVVGTTGKNGAAVC